MNTKYALFCAAYIKVLYSGIDSSSVVHTDVSYEIMTNVSDSTKVNEYTPAAIDELFRVVLRVANPEERV